MRILLEDAAGNRTPIFGPVTRTITSSEAIGPGSDPALRGAANGDGASDLARLTAHWGRRGSRTLLVSRFGRTHVVRGRLRTADGAPIANAAIDVVSKTTAVNARELAKRAGPRTGARRRVARRAAAGRLLARRDLPLPQPRQRHDRVGDRERAACACGPGCGWRSIRAARGRGRRSASDGRLLGGPLPRGGKQVVLMARASRGAWVRFNVVRTDRRRALPRRLPLPQPGAALYRFRALSLSEAAYPYLAGGSNVVEVRKG